MTRQSKIAKKELIAFCYRHISLSGNQSTKMTHSAAELSSASRLP
jgi:hypothetical protein